MSDDYLWDGSGEPDPAVRKLEELLGEARYRPPKTPRSVEPNAPNEPGKSNEPNAPRRRVTKRRATQLIVSAAFAIAIATCALWMLRPRGPSLVVKRVSGTARVAARPIGDSSRFYPGSWLETDGDSGAEIALAGLGSVDVGPRSRVRLRATGPSEQRLELERGSIHARVTAPPRLFVVDTPAAAAVDLGCEYTLAVDDQKVSHLEVTRGEVELAGAGRVSRVPAGCRCDTHPNAAPGIPYASDAPEPLKRALGAWESGGGRPALDDALAHSRRADAPTLWNLLERTDGADQKVVADRLGALVPPPADRDREAWWGRVTGD
ncbi:MAG TPA: FecR family protein [Polyangia bacterium]|nr:FecR family protein [Polyangia bacterium]